MKKRYILENLECANCAAIMEEKISKLDGVKSVNINFFTTKMTLEFDDDLESEILDKAQDIITKLEPNTKVVI
ncbi:cation transporter [Campylobacter corcagiensis]|uniref:Heavy-metal-associated domain-containing protein n=1 Tax=Campylobacter corcagiensis TaxID=1448857 RepID=A0A7M1LFR1_9BACT|nr:heavy metal-associated domain-containing protein [Campylobacter corcagiensis]QKF64426.1 heavy-metal-associated domain-containing protein [Campylobacter corcagiensis]QOQ87388.1 heavy-metal-associated domain-containing protein [Campylobacter corcagiensis]